MDSPQTSSLPLSPRRTLLPRLLLPLLLLFLTQCTATRPAAVPQVPPLGRIAAEEVDATADEEAWELPSDWHLQNSSGDFPGINLAEAYALAQGRTPQPVIVAVIDSGVDIEHEDLQGRIWTNEGEIPGNGIDDDGNGYVDDVHGWSFLGNPNGENVEFDTYEVTREYVRLRGAYENARADRLPPEQQEEYAYFQRVRDEFQRRRQEAAQVLPQIESVYEIALEAVPQIEAHFGKEDITFGDLYEIGDEDEALAQARNVYAFLLANGITLGDLKAYYDRLSTQLNYNLNADFDPRGIVGDNYADLSERHYGNNDVAGPDASHGTHVAGIIAALRDNDLGATGVADAVRIMSVRAVPDGDERDKDVANAIRYAADNGARIINMSFGKSFSPHKEAVDEAVRYAAEKGVLLIHAAGNSSQDNDVEQNFPTAYFLDGDRAQRWLTVGASSWDAEDLAANFTNYGHERVDLFAPGVDIYSTLPGSEYGPNSGTSMAAPVVSGVAALILSYYPELTADQLRQILLDSVRRYEGELVALPGGEEEVDFCSLSVTCGIVDAASAMMRAAEVVGAGAP